MRYSWSLSALGLAGTLLGCDRAGRQRPFPESDAMRASAAEASGAETASMRSPAVGMATGQPASALLSPTVPPGTPPGIPFGPYHLPDDRFGAPFTGALRNGNDPAEVRATLDAARAAHVHVILNMFVGRKYITRPDGSFDLERWKSRIDRFRDAGLESYIADGTLIGHYLLDEPHDPSNWDGAPVPLADIEAAAAYSKSIWPTLPTFVRTHPAFLAKATFRWVALDAAWSQFSARRGDARGYAERNAAAARKLGLGLVVGLNVLDGGEGRSGQAGPSSGKWTMSPDEVREYGSALASEPWACGLFMWKYDRKDASYFDDPQIVAALGDVARIAAAHPAMPCRVH